MNPLTPLPATPVDSAPVDINRYFVVEENGHVSVRDGGPPAHAEGVYEVTRFIEAPVDKVEFDEADMPEGIDYPRWASLVKPATRNGFADPLDFIDD